MNENINMYSKENEVVRVVITSSALVDPQALANMCTVFMLVSSPKLFPKVSGFL